MKKGLQQLTLVLLAAALLTIPVLADMGPKPHLAVKVANPPDELYYLDLLAEGDFTGDAYGGHSRYGEKVLEGYDQALLETLRAAVPDGWHACMADGTNGPPMWGDLTAEAISPDGMPLHSFGYLGLPKTYQILIVTQRGDIRIFPPQTRQALQSSVTVDWESGEVSTPAVWVAYVLQFLATLLPTLVIEGLVLLAFGYSWRSSWKVFLLINLLTQGALSLFLTVTILKNGVNAFVYLLVFLPAELAVALMEAGLCRKYLTGRTKARATAYALTANTVSAVLGFFLAEPIWRFIVSIS